MESTNLNPETNIRIKNRIFKIKWKMKFERILKRWKYLNFHNVENVCFYLIFFYKVIHSFKANVSSVYWYQEFFFFLMTSSFCHLSLNLSSDLATWLWLIKVNIKWEKSKNCIHLASTLQSPFHLYHFISWFFELNYVL